MELAERVAALSDFAAVVACQDLAAALAARPDVSVYDAADQLPPELSDQIDPETLKTALDEHYHVALPPEVSIELARTMLAVAAADPDLAPSLARVLDETQDTKQFALEVLALGAAISMVIATATSKKDKHGWSKEALTPALAKALGYCFGQVRPFVPGASGTG